MIKVIGEHLIREGNIELANCLQEETGVQIDGGLRDLF